MEIEVERLRALLALAWDAGFDYCNEESDDYGPPGRANSPFRDRELNANLYRDRPLIEALTEVGIAWVPVS